MKRLASVTVAASSWRFIAGGGADALFVHLHRERIYTVAQPGFASARLCLVKGEWLDNGDTGVECRRKQLDKTGVLALGVFLLSGKLLE